MPFKRVFAVLLCVLAPIGAVETRTWEQADQADFDKGHLSRLSLSSEGHLTPAPVLKDVHDPAVTFLWAIARNSKGNLYAGGGTVGGSKCRLIEVEPGGKARSVVELDGMAIQAIVIDRQDRIYAATSPDGKVYRIDASGKADVYYDPKTKYIWSLALGRNGDLFVATGDEGEIHRVTANGMGSVFYKTEEAHVRSMTMDAAGNLIVGTDPSGLILRVSTNGNQGQGFVLYEAPKREITALAIGADGMIYAASTGNKQPAAAPAAPAAPGRGGAAAIQPAAAQPAGRGGAPPATAPGNPPAAVVGGSELYRIQPDGYARKMWAHAQDVIYALTMDSQGRVIAGTGNRGYIYRIDSDQVYTRLLDVSAAQITGFASAPDGKLYLVTGNIGGIFSVGPERESSGTIESDVLDAAAFSYWGRLTSLVAGASGANAVGFETRSGNTSRPQKDWSPWAKPDGSGRIASPAARFLQYRATINGTAELYDVAAAYEMKNVAPVIDAIETTPANYRTPGAAAGPPPANPLSLTLPAIGRRPAASSASDSGNTPTLTWAKGQIGARWAASDENGDTLLFKIEIRGENETTWKLLKDGIRERYHSWDSTAFADGKYYVRITATDAASNPPDQALTSTREGDRFLIDNSAPEVSGLAGTVNGTKIDVRFHAKDSWNTLDKAEYSVNGGEWKVVEPTTRLTDSEEHDYRFQTDRGQGEVTIAVRVTDAYSNEATAKTIVK